MASLCLPLCNPSTTGCQSWDETEDISAWKAWTGHLVIISTLTCSNLLLAAWRITFKFKGYCLNVSTILNLGNENYKCCFVPSTVASLTLSKKDEDRYSALAVCIYTFGLCIIQHAEPLTMTPSDPVDSNCTFQSTYWCWFNICVNNIANTVVVFSLPLVFHEFWEFKSSVWTITPGKSQHSSLALCRWQPSVASGFLHIHLQPFEKLRLSWKASLSSSTYIPSMAE